MIKVIHIISDTNIGGAGRWLLNFLKYIDNEKFNITIIMPEGSLLEDEIIKLEIHAIKLIKVDGMADKSFDINIIESLYRLLKTKKPDIVHTHASLSGRISARLAGVKNIVHTKHCIDEVLNRGVKKWTGAFVNSILSDKIIAVSEAARANLLASGINTKKVITIYNGIEALKELTEEYKNISRKKFGINRDEIVVSVVARLEEVKGHRYFIEAAGKVLEEYEQVRFIIIGTGSQEDKLNKMVEAFELKDKVIFAGHIEDITELMNITDINVLPSISEAFGLSIVEAMSLGKACIATKTGGIPEVIEDGKNGLLVPIRDSDVLAEAILRLIRDSELRNSLGIFAREKAEHDFSARTMTNKVAELYESLA